MRPPATVNGLIEGLPPRDRNRLINGCEPVDLVVGESLCGSGEPVDFAWFPLSGFISRGAKVPGHPTMEVGMTGNEGMLGEVLSIGVQSSPWRGVVLGPGTALRIPAADFVSLAAASPAIESAAYHYLYVMIAMAARSVSCTRFHRVEARLARWLLMTGDRMPAGHCQMTHELLAEVLGVQRSAVTIAAGALQERGLIRYSRGHISIVSQPRLEAASCGCYGEARRDYVMHCATGT